MNLFFIVNPVAGNGFTLNAIPKIEEYCSKRNIHYEIEKTRYAGHATKLSRDARTSGFDAIIAVGGDGTLLETANGLLGSSIPLGVIPAGTGNDFARSIGVPSTVEEALNVITMNRGQPIDVGKIGDICFMNVASIGFDAEIIVDIAKLKKFVSGKISYYLSVFLKFFSYKFKKVHLEIDGKEMDLDILLLAIANGCYYGGGMKVNPSGLIEDGYLDVIVITPLPRYKIPLLLAKFVKGKYQELPFVKTFKARNIKVYSDEKLPINADGDIVMHTPAEFSISPLSLNIIRSSTHFSQEVLHGSHQ